MTMQEPRQGCEGMEAALGDLPATRREILVELLQSLIETVGANLKCVLMKFADMKARHRVLYGENPFAAVEIPRDAAIRRLRQMLLNLKLRLRERYVLEGDRSDRLA